MSYSTKSIARKPLNERQRRHYWRLWGAVRRELRARGFSPAEADARRKEIHIEADAVDDLGQPVSSKDLTNPQFTRIKAAFLATLQPDNLDAQLESFDNDVVVMRFLVRARARDLLKIMGDVDGYVLKIAKQMGFGYSRLDLLDLAQIRKVFIALDKQVKRRDRPKPQQEMPF